MSTELSKEAVEALENILDVIVPETVSWSDIQDHLRGYNRKKAIEAIVEKAKEAPLFTKIKLYLIYSELKKLADNGGLL